MSMKSIAAVKGVIFQSNVNGQFGKRVCSSNHNHCFLSANSSAPPPPPRFSLRVDTTRLSLKRQQQQQHNLKVMFITKAADTTPPSATAAAKTLVPDDEFFLAKVSFGIIGLGVGISLLSYSFGAYFNALPGSEWSALMLTCGFPHAIIGMSLKYAELKPVTCLTYFDAQSLREKYATPILKQGGGIPRRNAPILQMICGKNDGLVLVFEAKALWLSDFEQRQAKFASIFGPNITAEIGKGENNLYEVRPISDLNAEASTS